MLNHVRVATYDITSGTAVEVAQAIQEPGGMAEVFRAMAGFESYSILEVSPTEILSITAWETHADAEQANVAVADWMAANPTYPLTRTFQASADALFLLGPLS